ncbi:hypothetical protein L9F63_027294, partial [Diploptera punctata]
IGLKLRKSILPNCNELKKLKDYVKIFPDINHAKCITTREVFQQTGKLVNNNMPQRDLINAQFGACLICIHENWLSLWHDPENTTSIYL